EEGALPRLAAVLSQDDTRGCESARTVLVAMAARLQPERRSRCLSEAIAASPRFSSPGQQQLVACFLDLLDRGFFYESRPADAAALARLLEMVKASTSVDVHLEGLGLVEALLARSSQSALPAAAREVVALCLRHPTADVRCQAIRLSVRPEVDRRETVVP